MEFGGIYNEGFIIYLDKSYIWIRSFIWMNYFCGKFIIYHVLYFILWQRELRKSDTVILESTKWIWLSDLTTGKTECFIRCHWNQLAHMLNSINDFMDRDPWFPKFSLYFLIWLNIFYFMFWSIALDLTL